MKLTVFCIFDSKAVAFMQPFFMQSRGQAIRSFSDLANDSSTNIAKHPEDYTLFEIGSYEDSTGKLLSLDTPHSCGLASEFIKV